MIELYLKINDEYKRLYSTKEYAMHYNIKERTLQKRKDRKNSKLKFIKIGNNNFYYK